MNYPLRQMSKYIATQKQNSAYCLQFGLTSNKLQEAYVKGLLIVYFI